MPFKAYLSPLTKGEATKLRGILKTTFIILFLSIFVNNQNLFSAKLDLSVNTSIKAISYKNLNFATTPVKEFFYLTDASFGIILNDYIPVSNLDTSVDIGLLLHAVNAPMNITSSIYGLPYNTISGFYPNTDFTPFIEQAYVRVKKLFDIDLTLTAGRQSFMLGSGLLLADNGLGLTGFNLQYDNTLLYNITAKLFAFQPQINTKTIIKESNLFGGSLEIPTNGLWQIYGLREINIPQTTFTVISNQVSRTVKDFAGISYQLKTTKLVFEGEGAVQKGYSKKVNSSDKIKYNGSAFLLKGTWLQRFSRLGTGSLHIAFGRASGDKPATLNINEAFFPGYGLRYKGLERKGFGEVLGASLYDGWGGDNSTATGFPAGISGLQVVNAGVQLPPYKNFHIVLDYFNFQADKSITGKILGNEFDVKLYYLLGNTFKMILGYGIFTPSGAYPDNTPKPSKLSFEVIAKF